MRFEQNICDSGNTNLRGRVKINPDDFEFSHLFEGVVATSNIQY